MNIAVIRGSLSRDPEERALPSGDRAVNYEVTVRDLSPAESVPVVWIEPTKGWDALVAGDEVVVFEPYYDSYAASIAQTIGGIVGLVDGTCGSKHSIVGSSL